MKRADLLAESYVGLCTLILRRGGGGGDSGCGTKV